MLSHRLFLAGLLSFMACAATAESGTFDISLLGLRAGHLTYTGQESGGRYTASGAVRSSALARAVIDVQIDTEATGRVSGNAYRPASFQAVEHKDGKTIRLTHSYRNGVPTVTRDPAKKKRNKHAANPAQQAGTLDQMTTAFAILRDRPKDLTCALSVEMFDGERRHGIRYATATRKDDGRLECHGEYRRLAGFKPKEMAEKPVWPFTVIYEPKDAQMRVVELRIPTTLGNIRMVRR